jgi:hypothetical protein
LPPLQVASLRTLGATARFLPRRPRRGHLQFYPKSGRRINRRGSSLFSMDEYGFSGPEGCWRLAGGANHRKPIPNAQARPGRGDGGTRRQRHEENWVPAPLLGRISARVPSRWLAPPANLQEPSGQPNNTSIYPLKLAKNQSAVSTAFLGLSRGTGFRAGFSWQRSAVFLFRGSVAERETTSAENVGLEQCHPR